MKKFIWAAAAIAVAGLAVLAAGILPAEASVMSVLNGAMTPGGASLASDAGLTAAMTCLPVGLNHRARGLIGAARADGSTAKDILEELQKTFEAFKAERDKELADINNRLGDVVQSEKVDRINAEITDLTKALDDVNRAIAALRVGGQDGLENDPDRIEHAGAFAKWFRKGIDNGLSDLEVKAGLTTESDPDGGYLVPTETERTIDRVLGVVSIMRSIARVMPIGTDEYRKFVNMGGAGGGWVGEDEERPETDTPRLRELIFTVMELYANPATTQKMLDDGIIDIADWLADEVNITFAEKEGAAFISGTGVKQPRGILAYDKVANNRYAWGKTGFVASGAAAGFKADHPGDAFVDLYYALRQGYRMNASWLMSDIVMGSVRKFKDGQGNYIWAPPSETGAVPTILGKPVRTDDNMPGLDAGAFPVVFADFMRSYLIVDRTGIRVLRDPYTNKPKIHFYTTKRVGGGISNFEAVKLMKCSA